MDVLIIYWGNKTEEKMSGKKETIYAKWKKGVLHQDPQLP